jgi:hypothetical protein
MDIAGKKGEGERTENWGVENRKNAVDGGESQYRLKTVFRKKL